MSDIIPILFSWAVTLSGYPAPAVEPMLHYIPHHELEVMACGGQRCPVLGWHPPGHDLYFDDRIDPEATSGGSIIIHEYTHYLQEMSGKFHFPSTCDQAEILEAEASSVQQRYLNTFGSFRTVGRQLHGQMHCEDPSPIIPETP